MACMATRAKQDAETIKPSPQVRLFEISTRRRVHEVVTAIPFSGDRARTPSGLHKIVIKPVDKSRQMMQELAIEALSALAQPTRLEAFRLLVRQEPHGLPAGEIARRLDVPHNTMSTHLAILTRAGLIMPARHSRSVIYRADLGAAHQLVLFLLKDCCNGQPELCALIDEDIEKSRSTSGGCCG